MIKNMITLIKLEFCVFIAIPDTSLQKNTLNKKQYNTAAYNLIYSKT